MTESLSPTLDMIPAEVQADLLARCHGDRLALVHDGSLANPDYFVVAYRDREDVIGERVVGIIADVKSRRAKRSVWQYQAMSAREWARNDWYWEEQS